MLSRVLHSNVLDIPDEITGLLIIQQQDVDILNRIYYKISSFRKLEAENLPKIWFKVTNRFDITVKYSPLLLL